MSADAVVAIVGTLLAVLGALLAAAGQFRIRPGQDADQPEKHASAVPTNTELRGARTLKVETWASSFERDAHFRRRTQVYCTASGGSLLVLGGILLLETYRAPLVVLAGQSQGGRFQHLFGLLIVVVGGLVLCFSAIPYLSARAAFRNRRAATASARVDEAIEQLAGGAEGEELLPLEKLFKLNRRQLDAYQQTTRRQQQLAFGLAQAASVVAFLVLVAGVVTALAVHTDVEKYLAAGLSALGSTLSAFLAATFFASQQDANVQLNRYYLEPQRTGRLLAAERALVKIKDSGDAALLAEIVHTVLAWEMPRDGTPSRVPSRRAKLRFRPIANGAKPAAGVPAKG